MPQTSEISSSSEILDRIFDMENGFNEFIRFAERMLNAQITFIDYQGFEVTLNESPEGQ